MSEKDYDPQMHTIEHILNGHISSRFGIDRAFSTHIERKKSKIDFRYTRNFTAQEIAEIEVVVNEIMGSAVAVTDQQVPLSEAIEKYNLSRLPDETIDKVRIVHIGEYDSCPCIGAHVSNTDQIEGVLRIISTDFNEQSSVLRVRFKKVNS